MSPDLRRILGELFAVLVLSALAGAFLLAHVDRPAGVAPPGAVALLAAFYYPLSFPVGALVKALPLGEAAASRIALYATLVVQNVALWLLVRWAAKATRAP